MSRTTIIVAYDEERGIGKNGTIPWKIPSEMAHFKSVTTGHPVIMGRNTWDSIPAKYRPLPDRTNIVVSTLYVWEPKEPDSRCWYFYGAYWVTSVLDALEEGQCRPGNDEVFVIGGEQIYQTVLENEWADRVLASEIKGRYEADKFFPQLTGEWKRNVLSQRDLFDVVEYVR